MHHHDTVSIPLGIPGQYTLEVSNNIIIKRRVRVVGNVVKHTSTTSHEVETYWYSKILNWLL